MATLQASATSGIVIDTLSTTLNSALGAFKEINQTLMSLPAEIEVYGGSSTSGYGYWGMWRFSASGSFPNAYNSATWKVSSLTLRDIFDDTNFIKLSGKMNPITGGTISSLSFRDGDTSVTFGGTFKLIQGLNYDTVDLSSLSITKGDYTLTLSGSFAINTSFDSITSGTITALSIKTLSGSVFKLSDIQLDYSHFQDLLTTGGEVDSFQSLINQLTLSGNDLIIGDDQIHQLNGGAGNDTLQGGLGDDTLDGGSGNDSLVGGAGDDLYVVNSSKDVVIESKDAGEDTIESSVSYTLSANVETLQLTGSLDINATGNALANTLMGNSGANILNGGIGADTMQGGDGDDTYLVDQTGDVVTESENEGTDTIRIAIATKGSSYSLADNAENGVLTNSVAFSLIGNDLNNILTGNAAANTLDGGIGNDSLLGGAGNDSLLGGTGDDTLDGGVGNDTMDGGEGSDLYFVNATGDVIADSGTGLSDIDVVQSTVNYTLNDGVENLILTGKGNLSGIGSNQQNVITGNTGANRLDGGAGDDTLYGGLGADSLMGGLGADQLEGGAGNDTYEVDDLGDVVTELANEGTDLVNSSIDYTLGDYLENLTLTGTGPINATGNSLNNILIGNDGNNVLSGGAGIDVLKGGKGNDTYQVNLISSGTGTKAVAKLEDSVSEAAAASGGDDTLALQGTVSGLSKATVLTLAAGLEHLDASATGDTWLNLSGNAANNALTGNDANNILRGLAGNDSLTGGDGADTLYGGLGNDTLTGGDGADVFVFDSKLGATNVDTITDFEVGVDKLQLSKTIFSKFTVAGGVSEDNLLITNNSSQALDANDYLIFDATDGSLYYDKDGNGAGVAVKFATLADLNGTLTADDFIIGA
jgi:Ca2+-binding RTX toxin-like protein